MEPHLHCCLDLLSYKKWCHLRCPFSFGMIQKSHRAKYVLCGGCTMAVIYIPHFDYYINMIWWVMGTIHGLPLYIAPWSFYEHSLCELWMLFSVFQYAVVTQVSWTHTAEHWTVHMSTWSSPGATLLANGWELVEHFLQSNTGHCLFDMLSYTVIFMAVIGYIWW